MTNPPSQEPITLLLQLWREGDESALTRLMPLVYEELHHRARFYMQKERPNHTLSSTALVNEAFVGLVKERERDWQSRAHFFSLSAKIMKNILITYANARNTQKRGGDHIVIVPENIDALEAPEDDLLIPLNEALDALNLIDSQKASIMEMRYFAGMTVPEIAEVTGLSSATVKRYTAFASAWLQKHISSKGKSCNQGIGSESKISSKKV